MTLAILAVLAAVFLKGFSEAIGLATAAALPYLALNVIVLGRCLFEILTHPTLVPDWQAALAAKGDPGLMIAGAVLVFPKLALGLSGFETGVSVMPLNLRGRRHRQHHRVRQRGDRSDLDLRHLTRRGLMGQAVRYLLFGEGETGLMVYAILLRYWEWTPRKTCAP